MSPSRCSAVMRSCAPGLDPVDDAGIEAKGQSFPLDSPAKTLNPTLLALNPNFSGRCAPTPTMAPSPTARATELIIKWLLSCSSTQKLKLITIDDRCRHRDVLKNAIWERFNQRKCS